MKCHSFAKVEATERPPHWDEICLVCAARLKRDRHGKVVIYEAAPEVLAPRRATPERTDR